MKLINLTESEYTRLYQSFINQSTTISFEQMPEMAQLRKQRGYDVTYLGLFDDNSPKAIALTYHQKIFGGKKMNIYYGPIYTHFDIMEEFLRHLKHYAKSQNVLELSIFPYDNYAIYNSTGHKISTDNTDLITLYEKNGFIHQGLQINYVNGEIYWHYLKDISKLSPETLLNTFNKNSQRNIKKAQNLGIQVRQIDFEEIYKFKEVIDETGERQSFNVKSLDFYQKFYQAFSSNVSFLVAEINFTNSIKHLEEALKNNSFSISQIQSTEKQINLLKEFEKEKNNQDVILASALIINNPTETTYLMGGSLTKYQKLAAPFLLQYEAMCDSLKKEIPLYNFLGITGNFDGSDGVLRFKQNFNGYITRKMGTFRYYPKPLKYKTIQFIKKVLRR